ncbi:hypothetical protein WMY93_024962 [Mugilogobius chulae]|uniref:Nardilysin n=1 Tax=Mugilogobius chulae TaxID=88201 RepID=A0AAW0NB42_9GOBI
MHHNSRSVGGSSPPAADLRDPPPPAEPRGPDPCPRQDQDQGDPDICKSPNDLKNYRYLELSNGLRILLISDQSVRSESCSSLQRPEDVSRGSQEFREEQSQASEEGDSWSSEEGDSWSSEEGEDMRPWKPSDKQAAAALCVAVGSFSDPDELPGLAHFLEHMVFMGSQKYPEENGFDAFLKNHGGSDNAFTDCERTVFYFDIKKQYFREALDRWAQFFVCPLMIEDAVDRELEAVDSEFQLARPSDSQRKEMLFGTLAKPGHPMGKFPWGNTQSLKLEPREKGINVYEHLRQFWRRYYTAQYMTLAVQSRESLDTLEQWVTNIFIHVPNNGEPPVDFSHLQNPFDTPDFNKLYRVVPVKKVHALTISWALPPQAKHYRVKPLHYISWLIEHEGKGSILSLLRKKCGALALFGGNCESGFEQNSTFSIFFVSITLTDKGFANFYLVAHVVFQYLKMLQTLGPQQRIYEEIQKILDNDFRYQEQMDPADFVQGVCENMQRFPKEHFLTGNELLFEFNSEVISSALSLLTPLRANLMLLSPENQGQCDLTEKWFGTSYSKEDLPQYWSELWASDFELNPDLQLPGPNRFITSDFSLRDADRKQTQFPELVESSRRGALWYKKDSTFNIPKVRTHIRFHLISPVVQRSPENLVFFDLLVNILAHNLSEPAFDARVALLDYKLVASEHGLVIQLQGFNHKLPLLLKLIVSHLANFTSDSSVFEVFCEQLKKVYYNQLLKPERLGKEVRLQILQPRRWPLILKHQALVQGLSLDRLLDFVSEFKRHLFVEGLVQGNVTCQESKKFLQYFLDELQFQPLPAEVPVQFQVVKLPQKHFLCKVKSLNPDNANSEVTVYYQCGVKPLKQHALMELWSQMEEPCFDYLRTKETLGYQVFPSYRNTSGILDFPSPWKLWPQSSARVVESKIEAFLQAFGGVEALVKQKQSEDSNLGEEVDALLSFSQNDLKSCFDQLRQENRKLSVHVVGFGAEEDDTSPVSPAEATSSYTDVNKLHFLPASSPWLREATPIRDIAAFTADLPLHPFHKTKLSMFQNWTRFKIPTHGFTTSVVWCLALVMLLQAALSFAHTTPLQCEAVHRPDGSLEYRLSPDPGPDCVGRSWQTLENRISITQGSIFNQTLVQNVTNASLILKVCMDTYFSAQCPGFVEANCTFNCSSVTRPVTVPQPKICIGSSCFDRTYFIVVTVLLAASVLL